MNVQQILIFCEVRFSVIVAAGAVSELSVSYPSIPIGEAKSEYAVWTYEKPYEAMASIKEYLAFYPTRVDAIEVAS